MRRLALALAIACSPFGVGSCAGARSEIRAGRYSAEVVGEQRYLQIEAREDGTVVVRNIIALHDPPAEVETHAAKVTVRDRKICLEPAPVAIDSCLVSVKQDALVVKTREGIELELKRAPSE